MKMSLEELLRNRVLQKTRPDRRLAERTFELAERDVGIAKVLYGMKEFDWCLATAYNAMLQAGR